MRTGIAGVRRVDVSLSFYVSTSNNVSSSVLVYFTHVHIHVHVHIIYIYI